VDPWTDRLSEYIDDELTDGERESLERHLSTCAECRQGLAELQAVVRHAATLPPRVPALDLWPGVEQRIRAVRPVQRRISLSFAQLAAAAVLLMAVSGGLVWMLRSPAQPSDRSGANIEAAARAGRAPATTLPVSFADETFDRAVADLQQALERGRDRLDPDTVRIVQQNLAAIDAAIAQAQSALESDPSNTYLNGHLVDARRRKLALLRSVSALADPEG
jgi:anti-sigma factor RsiW